MGEKLLEHELEVKVGAKEAWELYGTLELAQLVEQTLHQLIHKIDVVEGDGGVGTVIKLTFVPGMGMPASQKEKFTKVDNEKRVKEVEVIEGGYLELGLTLYRVRFEIIEKASDSCIIKSSIQYDVKDREAALNASSFVSIQPIANIAQAANTHLLNVHRLSKTTTTTP